MCWGKCTSTINSAACACGNNSAINYTIPATIGQAAFNLSVWLHRCRAAQELAGGLLNIPAPVSLGLEILPCLAVRCRIPPSSAGSLLFLPASILAQIWRLDPASELLPLAAASFPATERRR